MARAAPPIWLARPGRFAGWSRGAAAWAAIALAVLLIVSFTALSGDAAPEARGAGADGMTDLGLYDGVIDGLRAGGHYYQLTADSLRAGGYPLRPFITFRLPLHSVVQALLPPAAALAILWLLAIGVAAAWWLRLRDALARPLPRVAAMILLAGGMVAFVQFDLMGFHEIWAAQLIALSLALRRADRWVEAVALAAIALLVRETAALYVLVMGALAFAEGHRREALGWCSALGLFALALVAHAWAVAQVVAPLDPRSPGWSAMLGFGFFVRALGASGALQLLPLVIAAPLVALALFGWASWRDPLALRACAVFAAYAAAIGLFARADTFYWALMVAPAFLVGLAFVPDGLRDVARAIVDRPRVRIRRVTR